MQASNQASKEYILHSCSGSGVQCNSDVQVMCVFCFVFTRVKMHCFVRLFGHVRFNLSISVVLLYHRSYRRVSNHTVRITLRLVERGTANQIVILKHYFFQHLIMDDAFTTYSTLCSETPATARNTI